MDKVYFAGKFEVIDFKFLKSLYKYKKNNEKEVIFLFYDSELISFEDRKKLLEEHLQDLNYKIYDYNKKNKDLDGIEGSFYTRLEKCNIKKVKNVINKFHKLRVVDAPINYVKYILDHHYFIYDKIFNLMTEERYKHTVSVALTALEIAKSNNIRLNKPFIAAMLHDIAKDCPKYVIEETMLKSFKNHIKEEKVVYHQFVGALFARKLFKIYNKDILKSIKYHTTGSKNMSTCAKIVYCSDKIEPTRGYDSKYMIDACKKEIRTGFELVLSENIKFLLSKNVKLDGLASEVIDFYRVEI
jgi:predicted HD superfamily hydrolase involved in NAD metabolism